MTEPPESGPVVEGKPDFAVGYREWLLERHDVAVGAEARVTYEAFAAELARKVRGSTFWTALHPALQALHENYKVEKGAKLLPGPMALDLNVKSWESFWEKTYRINVLTNGRWPNEPLQGWAVPETWFIRVGDIVRSKVIVKYLDALPIVTGRIGEVARANGLDFRVGRVAKDDGYYAAHIDIEFPIKFSTGLDVVDVPAHVELQITTELQENIYDLAHRQYTTSRTQQLGSDDWRWEYQSDKFAANYLGHVLHYLEGMIMRLWEEPNGRNGR